MAAIVRVGKKGRIVLLKEVREALDIEEGALLRIYIEGGRAVIEPVGDVLEKLKGSVR